MIRTTNRPLTTCIDRCELRRHPPGRRALAAVFPALRGRGFSTALLWLMGFAATAMAAPNPIETDFSDDDILIVLPTSALTSPSLPDNAETLADTIQQQLLQARSEGDPRYLGYAQGLLAQWPVADMTDRLTVLRATLNQSLHRFAQARKDLEQVIARGTDRRQRIQARLTLANLELVQGRYEAARTHCRELNNVYPGLIAQSCLAQVQARTGNAKTAYRLLSAHILANPPRDNTSRAWVEGTLGELAAQLGNPQAASHWQAVLAITPDDLHTRAQLADWWLQRSDLEGYLNSELKDGLEAALAVTAGYEQVDALAVIRAIAMVRANHPEAEHLANRLRERFAEARWRGTLLHQRDVARFELDIEGNAGYALRLAVENWKDQREAPDTRLLLRAAIAAGDGDTLSSTLGWLRKAGQTDARFPEVGP